MGVGKHHHTIYMIDFGLTKKFNKNYKTESVKYLIILF
jgi:hypothetical protein